MDDDSKHLNRRKHPRHALHDAVRVIDRVTGQSVGTLANLSIDGLMLVNSDPLNADCLYQLKVSVNGSVIGDDANKTYELHVGVDCLWNSPAASVTAAAYWSGCQIIDVSDEDLAVIQRVVDVLAEDS